MEYILTIGSIRHSNITKERVPKLIEKGNGDKGIGIHRIFAKINFQRLDEKISDDEKWNIFDKYSEKCGKYFNGIRLPEKPWVSNPKINVHRGSPHRQITSDFIEELKENVKGARDFFRSIKDEYIDNETRPSEEVCIIDTPSFRKAIKEMAHVALDKDSDIKVEYIDFIKWVYWYSTNNLSKHGNFAAIRFERV
jgi:hypothetical protein